MRAKFLSVILCLFALIFVFSGCEQGTEGHVHSFSSQWSADKTYHWHQCISCPETEGREEHSWDSGVTIKEATEDENGKILYTCLICKYTKTEDVNKKDHEHSFVITDTDEKYLKTPANCLNKAVYYYSCFCGERGEETFEFGEALGHNFENYKSDNNATCGADGTKTAKCSRCDATDTVTDIGSKLPHTYSEQWDKDNDYHWHSAICEHTDEIKDKASHTWDGGVETVEATETIQGERLYTCTVCGQTKTVKTGYAEHVHNYIIQNTSNQYLKSPANCLDKAVYYYSCSCGEHGEATFEDGETLGHNFENYISDNNATCGKDGTKTAKCSRCDAIDTITDIGSKLPHTYSEQWDKDENYHWHSATCEHTDEIKDKSLHLWDNGVEAVEATETVQGEILYTCTVCGKTKTIKTGYAEHVHNYSDQWSMDDYYHWHNCVGCEQFSEKEEHNWDTYKIINEATYDFDGEIEFTCSVCGKTKTEILEKLKYSITFTDYDGRLICVIDVEEGTRFEDIKPNNPSRDHYKFVGWENNPEWVDETDKKILSDMTFTALYEIEQVEVTFKSSDGKFVVTETVDYGGTVDAPMPSEYIYDADNNVIILPELPLYYLTKGKIRSFSGWDKSLNNITEQTVITAKYEDVGEAPILLLEYTNKTLSAYIQNSEEYQLYAFEFIIDYTMKEGNIIFGEEVANAGVSWLQDGSDKLYTSETNDKIKEYRFIWSAKGNGVQSNNLDQFINIEINLNNNYLQIASIDFKVISINAIISYDGGESFERITPSVIYG